MGFALMWIEALGAALLSAAAAGAWMGVQNASWIPAATVLLSPVCLAAFLFILTMVGIEHPAAMQIAVAATCAIFVSVLAILARRKGRGSVLAAVAVVLIALPLLAGTAATVLTGFLKYTASFENSWFAYTLSWTLCYAIAGAFVWRRFYRGVRVENPQPLPSAAMLLSGSCLGVVLLLGTFWSGIL